MNLHIMIIHNFVNYNLRISDNRNYNNIDNVNIMMIKILAN